MDLNGVAAIVTGGASGLGNATAKKLAARGAKVSIFDLNEEVGKAAAAELGGAFFKVNVADDASVAEALEAAEALHGAARLPKKKIGSASMPCATITRGAVQSACARSSAGAVSWRPVSRS